VRRTWPRYLGIVVAIGAVMLIAACASSEKGASRPNGAQARGTGAEVASLLAGIPQRGRTLGYPRAPVTVEYFGDLQCPFCRLFTLGALRSLIQSYVRGGKLKIEYRSLESATRDRATFNTQQVAALAAGQQDKMWNFIELFYHEQGEEDTGYVTERYLQGLAQQVPGLNLIAWTAARDDPELADTIASDTQAAAEAGVTKTPSFVLGESRRTPYASAIKKLLRG
jgi:protein-disulfide isomerase